MTAIDNGKLEGWPFHLRTEYVDSGSNVDPEYEARIVWKHLMESTGKTRDACTKQLEELKFTTVMMEGSIGELSGGWQMKLRLAKAVLIDADILLLDVSYILSIGICYCCNVHSIVKMICVQHLLEHEIFLFLYFSFTHYLAIGTHESVSNSNSVLTVLYIS